MFVIAVLVFFFFNDTATTEIYTLSLHDALPIYQLGKLIDKRELLLREKQGCLVLRGLGESLRIQSNDSRDRKSTRLNSSHLVISYAVFCLKKKKKENLGLSFAFRSTNKSVARRL